MKDHGRIRVLLVGGEAGSREPATALREHLEGARVLSAPDADAGFEVLESRRIDCLVSTYRLPEGDGLTFFGAVREEYPDLPFVLFAGADDADLARRAISAGVAGYVRRGAGEEQYVVLAHRIRTAIEASPSAGDRIEREEVSRELQEFRDRYRLLFEKSQDAIALVEFEGKTPHIAEINEPFRTLFEPPGEGIVGKPLDDVVAAESQREEAENVSQRVRQGTYLSGELERMTVDGPRDFLWQAVPLTDPATGEVTRAFAIYRDVSALRERERALERERDRLDEFASIVSHDLRNPLQVARSHLEIARDTGGEDHFDTIERSLRRMETLLEDLLVLAREDGTVDGTEPIDIAALVETCWREDIAGNGSLDLRTDRTVMAEQSRLRQLFSNLLGNAVEHGSTSPDSQARQDALEHGSPEQSVSRDCAAGPGVGEGEPPGSTDGVEITVGDLPGGFYVADDGPGIPAEEREQVFESGYSTSDDGTGFGLSIVAEIAEAHGWAVDVVDADGGGARFEITGVDVVERE